MMQMNRRKANLFKIDTFVEKKNCLRCYRLHKKCDGGTPNCSRCSKSKTACLYTYNAAENKLNTLDTSNADLEINVKNLQRSLEQQQQAYKNLQEQFEQIKTHNYTLQNMNVFLSQALSEKVLQETQLASGAEKNDLIGIYRNTGYLHIRVTPPFNDVYQYSQEKAVGRNPLKTVAMEFILGAVYLLLGKRHEGYHYMNTARDQMVANNLNSPMGLICMFMMAENYLIDGKKLESAMWLQKINAMFNDMENCLNDPNKAQQVNNQLLIMSQLIDVNFVRTMSILWTQWAPQYFPVTSYNKRIDQYLRQVEISKTIENSIRQSPCGIPTFYFLKSISEIAIAMEHEIDTPNDAPFVTEDSITKHFNQMIEYSRIASDPNLRHTFNRAILIIKILVAVLKSNHSALEKLIVEMIETGCFTDKCPIPQDAVPLFILLQLLCYAQSPYFPKAVQQYEVWSKSYPTFAKLYDKWVDVATGPLTYPFELNGFEDYFVLLPHLNYMRQHNISFRMHLPIFEDDRTEVIDAIESLLMMPFDAPSSSTSPSVSDYSREGNVDIDSFEMPHVGEEEFVFDPIEFTDGFEIDDNEFSSKEYEVNRFV